MYNWTVDEKKIRQNKKVYAIWKLEQMVNFGLNGEKINGKELIRFWDKIKLDPARRRFLKLILHV